MPSTAETSLPQSKPDAPEMVTVTIPNMFQIFVVDDPLLHPDYRLVKEESEAWIGEFCSFPPKMRMKINKCNFSLFCAISAPHAPRHKFRTLCDWGNWVFPYDDMFDNGELKDDPEASERMMGKLMAPMLGEPIGKDREPIIQVHDSVIERMSQGPSKYTRMSIYRQSMLVKRQQATKTRFARAMGKYCAGALTQVEDQCVGHTPTLEEMVLIRRESAGVSPLYHLVEYAHDLRVPQAAFEDSLIQELEILGIDLVSICNDILSYPKEEREGVRHNVVAICRLNGMSAQQAFDEVSLLMQSRFDRWNEVEKLLNQSRWAGNRHVQKYVTGIKSVVQANITWSFKSERYLGKKADEVRKTRQMEVMVDPSFLQN